MYEDLAIVLTARGDSRLFDGLEDDERDHGESITHVVLSWKPAKDWQR